MSVERPAIEPIRTTHKVQHLSDEQLDQLQEATLQILEEVGVRFPSEKALAILADHGAQVDHDNQIVRIPRDLVRKALATVPRYFRVGARDLSCDFDLEDGVTYFTTDGCGHETIDFKTRQMRPSRKEDVGCMAHVVDYLSSMAFYWPMVSAQDYPATAPLHELDASFNNTVKHVQTETVMDEPMARCAVEMAQVVAGDEATMRQRPPLSSLICTIAPLAQDKGGMESALVFAEARLPVGFMSMATAGSTAPATIAGTIAVADAEMVAAMVLIQMAYPGAPTYHSMIPGIMHPHTGDFLGGEWDAGWFSLVGTELAHLWGVPTLAGIGTEAPTPEWESAVGMAASILMCALCGAETASGLGLRETCTLLYPEALVLDNESYETAQFYAAGMDFSPEDFALDIVKAVGPRGHYLAQKHTREQMRKWELSELVNQPSPESGYRDPIEVAREKTDWILENHHPQPLEEAQRAELTRILQAADRELS